MTRPAIRVAFVAAGHVSSPQAYMSVAETLVDILGYDMRRKAKTGLKDPTVYETMIFIDVGPALEFLKEETGGTRTLVLLSEMFRDRADKIAADHPKLKVILCTGARPGHWASRFKYVSII